jgi:3-methyladenine DNA glycosylase Tag
MFSLKVEDFPYNKITSIQYKTGIIQGEIVIYASGNKAKITHVLKDECSLFADWVRNYINENENEPKSDIVSKQKEKQSTPSEDRTETVIRQLKELGELKNQGILTEEEFQSEKAKILST